MIILNVFLSCGLRLAEIQELKISNINFDENKFTIIGKGNKERMCYLNQMTKEAILKYLEIRNNVSVDNKKDKHILFLSNRNRKLGRNTIKQIVKRAYTKAGLDPDSYSVHTFIKIIQEILGHSRVETTQIYTHIYNKNVEKAILEHPLAKFKMEDALAFVS